MDVPEDIREKTNQLLMKLNNQASDGTRVDPAGLIAQALLSERLAQKERDAKIAERMPITSPHFIATAIRQS